MAGEKVFGRNFRIPKLGDTALRSLKYIIMGFFLFAIDVMPLWSMAMFLLGDYYKTVDVRILKFSTDMSTLTMWVWLLPVLLVTLFYLVIGIGMITGKWHSQVPYEYYQKLIPEVKKEYSGR